MKNIVRKIRILSLQKKISQRNLAQQIGVSPSTLSRYFSEQTDIPSCAFIKLLKILGFNLNEVFQPFEDPQPIFFESEFERSQYLKLCDWFQKSVCKNYEF